MVAADPAAIPDAVEEMLRFDAPLHYVGRKLTCDTELHGQRLPKGSTVFINLAAANRDPRIFDHPTTFDITRRPNRHLAFFHGIHFCVGAPLARLEGQVFFEKVFAAFPDVAPGSAPAVRRTHNVVSRGWETRPVTL